MTCRTSEAGTICRGPEMYEASRREFRTTWCFRHRGQARFDRVIMAPVEISYYGPYPQIECTDCGAIDGDLFPGWGREWDG